MAEGTATRKQVVRKNLTSPDETRRFDKGKIDIANVGDAVVGRFDWDRAAAETYEVLREAAAAAQV